MQLCCVASLLSLLLHHEVSLSSCQKLTLQEGDSFSKGRRACCYCPGSASEEQNEEQLQKETFVGLSPEQKQSECAAALVVAADLSPSSSFGRKKIGRKYSPLSISLCQIQEHQWYDKEATLRSGCRLNPLHFTFKKHPAYSWSSLHRFFLGLNHPWFFTIIDVMKQDPELSTFKGKESTERRI